MKKYSFLVGIALAIFCVLVFCPNAMAEPFYALTDQFELTIDTEPQPDNAGMPGSVSLPTGRARPKVTATLYGRELEDSLVPSDWAVAVLDDKVFQLKRWIWGGEFFLQADFSRKSLEIVRGGTFGKDGGDKVPLDVAMKPASGKGRWAIRFEPALITSMPAENSFALSYRGITLAAPHEVTVSAKPNTITLGKARWFGRIEIDNSYKMAWFIPSKGRGTSDGEYEFLPGIYPVRSDELPSQALPAAIEAASPAATSPWPVDRAMTLDRFRQYPESAWQAEQAEFFRKIVATGTFDTLLVPLQVDGYAFDRIERSLMTKFIHERMRHNGYSLPNPTLVARALGDKKRIFDRQRIYELAEQLKAKRIVMPMAGHDGRGKMTIRVVHMLADNRGKFSDNGRYSQWERGELPFSDEQLPFQALLACLDDLLDGIGLKGDKLPLVEVAGQPLNLPASPAELFGAKALSPLEEVYSLQLLGILFPYPAPARENLIERSFVAAWGMKTSVADRKLLLARALMHLSRRPAALKVLGKPSTPEEKALFAYLNGNLAELEQAGKGIDNPFKRLLAQIEYQELCWEYTKKPIEEKVLQEITAETPEWLPLVARRALNRWRWQTQPNILVKALMDEVFPIEGFTADSLALGLAALGESPEDGKRAQLSPYEHYKQTLDKDGARLYGDADIRRLQKGDYLDLLFVTSEANLCDSVYRSVSLRALADEALEKIQEYEPAYMDHPYLTKLKANAFSLKAKDSQGAEKVLRKKAADRLILVSEFWDQGQDGADLAIYDMDFPKRYYRSRLRGEVTAESLENSLAYTNSSFWVVERLHKYYSRPGREKDLEGLFERIGGRFVGSPDRSALLAERRKKDNDPEGVKSHYKDAMAANKMDWNAYLELGKMAVKDDKVQEAFDILSGYPPFASKESPDGVALSHKAFDAALIFFKLGEIDKAQKLFTVAQQYQTGSESEMKAAALSALTKGALAEAAVSYLYAIKRYQSSSSIEDYIVLLHAMGYHEIADAVFKRTPPDKVVSGVLYSVLYGMRVQGKSDEEIAGWIKEEPSDANFLYLHDLNMVNRVPETTPSLMTRASEQTRKPGKRIGETSFAILPADSMNERRLRTYNNFQKGEYEKMLLTDTGRLDLIDSRFLPYLAAGYHYANQREVFRKVFDEFTVKNGKGQGYYLAEGVLAGLGDKADHALQQIRQAYLLLPVESSFSLYNLAELCEWLYEKTHDKKYLGACLEYAKRANMRSPSAPWPYSFLAKHGETEMDKLVNLGVALYLDRNSVRIKHFTEAEKAKAQQLFEKNNIFKAASSSGEKTRL